jgi:biotin-(acetyl-CoA carboxylase) ligase
MDSNIDDVARQLVEEDLARAEAKAIRELFLANLEVRVGQFEEEMTEALANPDYRVEIR